MMKVSGSESAEIAALVPPAAPLAARAGSDYLCSLGTNTVLGNVTNGLLALLFDAGAVN
jgi:hypothetical protein